MLKHFDLEHHIWITTNVFKYVIGEVLSQNTLDYLNEYYLDQVASFAQMMIPNET